VHQRDEASSVGVPRSAEVAPRPAEFAPCPSFLDLPSAGGVPKIISFSALAAFGHCPRRFYLERVLGLDLARASPVEEQGEAEASDVGLLDDEERNSGREVGVLVHKLLERLPASAGRPAPEVLSGAAEQWATALGMSLSAEDLERACALSLAAWESPLAAELAAPSALREAPFFFAAGETVVSGFMDFVHSGKERWLIVDYKTNALKGRSAIELAETYRLQTEVYCLAALRAGAPAVRMGLLFLEQPSEPVMAEYEAREAERLDARLTTALSGLREADFPATVGEACGYCPEVRLCRGMAGV
jgi:RecB family exonuclease